MESEQLGSWKAGGVQAQRHRTIHEEEQAGLMNGPGQMPAHVIAHRGDSDARPENTLAAFAAALEAGAQDRKSVV